jgi:hypothetical protein
MDTKTLVVGQDVYTFNNNYPVWFCNNKGMVVKVTPEGVEVQTADGLIRFDTNGKELDISRRDRLGFGPSPGDKFHTILWQSAPEFAPWELMEWYYVLYRVIGSVTSSQHAFLKHGDGAIKKFHTLQEAEKVAEELNKSMNNGLTSTRFSYQAVSQFEELEHGNICFDFATQTPQLQSLVLEICNLACSLPTFPVPVFRPDFELIKTPKGRYGCAEIFTLRDVVPPGGSGDLIEITDEKLLEKLRSIKGQYEYGGHQLFYYEHLMSTADWKVRVNKW